MEWVNNEDGSKCSCGWPRVVKLTSDGPILLCIGHTYEEGAVWKLPKEKPEGWPDDVDWEKVSFD